MKTMEMFYEFACSHNRDVSSANSPRVVSKTRTDNTLVIDHYQILLKTDNFQNMLRSKQPASQRSLPVSSCAAQITGLVNK